MKTCICYSLDFVPQLEAYLPSAYIVEVKDEKLRYMQRIASSETLESFAIEWRDTNHQKILNYIESVDPSNLVSSYNKGKKRQLSLDKLFQDDLVKKSITQKIHRTLDAILSLIVQSSYPLCDTVERKVLLEDIRIKTKVLALEPKLYFTKTQTGLNYELALGWEGKKIIPFNHDVKVLTDQSGWMLIDYQLVKLNTINGNKIKPFLKKEKIFIPDRIQKDYFEKFIKDIIGKVESEVEGFEVIENKVNPSCKLIFVEDLMSSKMLLSPRFQYGTAEFNSHDKSTQRVNISFDEGPRVHIVNRDQTKENQLLNEVTKNGLAFENGLFSDDNEDKLSLYNWVANHQDKFDVDKITFPSSSLNGQKVSTDKFSMDFSFKKGKDWFDLNAVIQIGNEQLIFADLINFIAKENRFYPLKNGSFFIIPEVWMNKYGNIAKFAKVENGKVKIASTHYTLLDHLESENKNSSKVYKPSEEEFEFEIPSELKATLRPYQYDGAKWLVGHYMNVFGSLLADDMGLGKTIQTLAVLLHAKNKLKESGETIVKPQQQLSLFETSYKEQFSPLNALVILPASLLFNWADEIQKFAPSLMVCNYIGPKRSNIDIKNFDIILTTYQTAAKDFEKLKTINFSYIILDESHYIKNRASKLFGSINQINSDHKITLSGTPIENSLSDLYTQMEFINPDILGTYPFFKKHFQDPIEKHQNEEALEDLNQIVAPFILRRTKEEVLDDLPEMTEYVIYSEMGKVQKTFYEKEKSAARNYLLELDQQSGEYKIHVFNLLLRLRKLANHPKILDVDSEMDSGKYNDVTAYLDTIIKSKNKVLVFTSFLAQIEIYKAYCNTQGIGYEVLTGKTPVKSRAQLIHRFKTDVKKQVFFISLKAGGVGVNLTEANYVIILDPWWNPFAEKQAIARAYRIGQKENVMVTRFITKDTVEDKILKLQQEKLKIAGDIIDLGEQPELTTSSIAFLLD